MLFRVITAVFLALLAGGAATARAEAPKADAVVATDGSGDYKSLQDAISAAPMRTGATDPAWVIFVKAGTYRERVYVQRERGNILVRGEDAARTVITYDLHADVPGPDGKPIGTFRTPTVQIDGDGMVWENLTIANGAGPVGQAVALRVDGDRVIFRHCRFLGWQDTVLVNRGRLYFADCYIEGYVDFIFGAATAYFDRCEIHCLRDGYVTAASTPEGQPYGLVFADCTVTGDTGVKTYLGRPWRNFARTVFLRTALSEVVRPTGWSNWDKPAAEKTARYAEFACTGPGAGPAGRVPWAQKQESGDSSRYTPAAVLAGTDDWRPVPGPTLHFAGDSTMADKPDLDYPERGWGQLFRELIPPSLPFINHAVNGRSTKSFRDLGHWGRLMAVLAPGDWVVIEFGHNDAKKDDPTRFTDPATDYRENLRRYVREVRERGATPILATPVVRRQWSKTGELEDSHGPYLTAMRAVATEEKVPLLEMEGVTRALVTRLGPTDSKPLYLNFEPGEHPRLPEGKHDNTHFTTAGARLVAALAVAEMRRLQLPFARDFAPETANPAPRAAPVKWKDALRQPAAWYASAEARDVADTVLLYQFPNGGWPKNREMTLTPAAEAAARSAPVPADEQMPTMDNNATHLQLRFLAGVITAGNGSAADRAAVARGLEYLLAAQYPNGGWPQFFPLREGYYSHITFNDDAMAEVLGVLHDVAEGRPPFAFVDVSLRPRAAAAVAKGVDCILRCQVVVHGVKTVWCAQHDEHTLAPAPARKFEPVSLSGGESVGVVRFLMSLDRPSPEVIAAVEAAVAWFRAVQIQGVRYERVDAPALPKGRDMVAVPDPTAPPLWARFYEIGTNRPIFTGRDAVVRYALSEIEHERRIGYKWYVDAPAKLLAQDYPAWRTRLGASAAKM